MNTPFEDQLRTTLAREADRAPEVLFLGTAPVRRRRPLQLAVAAAAVVVGLVVGTVALGSSSGRAIAGWTSTPRPVDPSVTAALAKACGIADPLIVDVRGRAGFVVGRPTLFTPGQSPPPSVPAVGDDHGLDFDCLVTVPGAAPDPDLRETVLAGEMRAVVTSPTSANPMVVLAARSPQGNGDRSHLVTWASGVVDPSVAKVVVQTPSGLVTATVADGRFAAWWPGNDGDVDLVRAYASDGSLLATADQLNCDSGGLFSPRITLPGQQPTGGCTAG